MPRVVDIQVEATVLTPVLSADERDMDLEVDPKVPVALHTDERELQLTADEEAI